MNRSDYDCPDLAFPGAPAPASAQNINPHLVSPASSAPKRAAYYDRPYQADSNWALQFPGQIYLQERSNGKFVALTFDDAPDSLFGPLLLDILSAYNVPATFFCLGTCAQQNPGLVQRIVGEGHIVANHSYDHADLTALTPEQVREEVLLAETVIRQITGLRTALFRPPFGALNNEVVQIVLSLGYKIILWNVDSLDWTGITGPAVAARVIPNTVPGSIILMHNTCGGSVQAGTAVIQSLPFTIEILRAEGYSFVTIPALLEIPAYQGVVTSH